MQGDFTRLRFDPGNGYTAVLMQQGRVHLDSDWNEQVQIIDDRIAKFFYDFIGQSGAPMADALALQPVQGSTNQFAITAGRRYVDGVLVVSTAPQTWTASSANLGATSGTFLVYLDVWSRVVTAAEDPGLLEPALGGPDTTLRQRTESQVRVWRVPAGCPLDMKPYEGSGWSPLATSYAQDVGWTPQPVASGGRLSVSVAVIPRDNRLYRVEIHAGNADTPPAAQPTFKWSADNASAAARVVYHSAHQLTTSLDLAEVPERARELFPVGAWFELTDLRHVLDCQPGLMGRVVDLTPLASSGGTQLSVEWGAVASQVGARQWTEPLLIRHWQTDKVAVQTARATWYALGDGGPKIKFSSSAAATYRNGDYWLIPVRANLPTTLGWDSQAQAAPPRHHYAPLALVDWTASGTSGSAHLRCPGPTFPPLTDVVAPPAPTVTHVVCLPPALQSCAVASGSAWAVAYDCASIHESAANPTGHVATVGASGFLGVGLPQHAVITGLQLFGDATRPNGLSDSTLQAELRRRNVATGAEDVMVTCTLSNATGHSPVGIPTSIGALGVDKDQFRYYVEVSYSGTLPANTTAALTWNVQLYAVEVTYTIPNA